MGYVYVYIFRGQVSASLCPASPRNYCQQNQPALDQPDWLEMGHSMSKVIFVWHRVAELRQAGFLTGDASKEGAAEQLA